MEDEKYIPLIGLLISSDTVVDIESAQKSIRLLRDIESKMQSEKMKKKVQDCIEIVKRDLNNFINEIPN